MTKITKAQYEFALARIEELLHSQAHHKPQIRYGEVCAI